MADLLAAFDAAVAAHPDHVALVDGAGRATSFRALHDRATAFAQGWHARGIRRGDRVLLAMRLDADLYAALAALWSLGATVVLPEPAMGLAGLRHAARTRDVSAFCASGPYGLLHAFLPELWPLRALRPGQTGGPLPDLPPPAADAIALISFTSGTSGAPKAIPRSHALLGAQHAAIAPLLHSDTPARDLVCFPVFVLINIASGRTSVLPNWKMSRLGSLRPETLHHWIAAQSITRALIPPTLAAKLTETPIPPTLTHVFTGGGPVFPDLLQRMQRARPDLRITCVYGSTEAEPIAHLEAGAITEDDTARMAAGEGLLVGRPVDAVRLRIEGTDIQVAGDHVTTGYLDPAQDTGTKIREGDTIWHRTGDIGRLDEAGRLWLLGRAGSEVATETGPLYPFPVELAARTWPGVRNAALIARNGAPCLIIEGDETHLPDWQAQAATLGIPSVKPIARMPMDRRHASKIDRKALAASR